MGKRKWEKEFVLYFSYARNVISKEELVLNFIGIFSSGKQQAGDCQGAFYEKIFGLIYTAVTLDFNVSVFKYNR